MDQGKSHDFYTYVIIKLQVIKHSYNLYNLEVLSMRDRWKKREGERRRRRRRKERREKKRWSFLWEFLILKVLRKEIKDKNRGWG